MALENTSRDGRLDFDTAINQLIRANYTPRDPATGKPTRQLTAAEIQSYRGQVNEEEVTQGYLQLMAVLSPQRSQIQFAVVDTQQVSGSPVTPLSRLLTMQDSFLISSISYHLIDYQFTGGSLQNPDFTSGTRWMPITYTAPWHNNSIAVQMDNGCDMFWQGAFLQLQVQKRVLIPYLDCMRFYKAPIAQETPSFPVPSIYMPGQQNSMDMSCDTFNFVQPNIVIGGGRTNNLYLNLAANIPATIAPFNISGYGIGETFVFMACVFMRGILMQNSTTVK